MANYRMHGNELQDSNDRRVGEIRGMEVLDSNSNRIGIVNANIITDASGRQVAFVNGDDIHDGSSHPIGTLAEARTKIENPPDGAALAALWFFFVR